MLCVDHAPERALWASVLQMAGRDLIAPWGAEARAWFASEVVAPGSFVWVCQMLGLEPSALRRQLVVGCALGTLDGSHGADVHRLKLIGREAGAPRRVRGRYSRARAFLARLAG